MASETSNWCQSALKEVLAPLNPAMGKDVDSKFLESSISLKNGTLMQLDSKPFKTSDVESQSSSASQNKKKYDQENHYKGYLKLCCSGVSLLAFAYLIYIINPLVVIKNIAMSFTEGSYLSNVWKTPPVKVYIKVYLFNLTNSEKFIKGEDAKLKLDEVGPFVYCETVMNDNVVWNKNSSVSFIPRRNLTFIPEKSIGHPRNFSMTVPDVALLGIASMLHNSTPTVNLALMTLVSYLNPSPIKHLTAEEFLWGYDDNLIKFASGLLPSWINFKKLGLLDRMMDEGENVITIGTEDTGTRRKFVVQRFNGSPRIKEWAIGPDDNTSVCDRAEGTVEGVLLPNLQPNESFTVFRKAFCRPIPLIYTSSSVSEKGFPMYNYALKDSVLDPNNPDNFCYCNPNEETCLPYGLSDLAPCYYGIPVAMSLPHFYKADPRLLDKLDGLSPDEKKHSSYLSMQPDVGIPLDVKSRIQLNLVVKKTRYVSRIKKFNNMVIPVVWLEAEMGELPGYIETLLGLLLVTGPVVQWTVISLFIAAGFVLLLTASFRYVWRSGILGNTYNANLISYSKKHQEDKQLVWAGQYSQIVINPARSR